VLDSPHPDLAKNSAAKTLVFGRQEGAAAAAGSAIGYGAMKQLSDLFQYEDTEER
jgi:hypothetical protein